MLFFISLLLLQEANRDILVDVLIREIPALLHHDNGQQSSTKQQLHCGSLQLLKDMQLACSHRQHPQDCLHLTELHMLNLSPIQKMLEGLIVLGTSNWEQEVK